MMNMTTRVAVAGLVSGVAYLASQSLDLAVCKNKVDDRILLGRLTPVSAQQAKLAGTLIHLANSVAFAAVFNTLSKRVTAGPLWLRGLLFANLENALLYCVMLLEDYHPAIRDGQLDSYQSWTAFNQAVWRHSVLGVVLGVLLSRRR